MPLSDTERSTLSWLAAEMGTALSAAASALQDSLLPATTAPLLADAMPPALDLAQQSFRRAREALGVAPMAELEVLCDTLAALFEALANRRRPARELVLGMADACHAIAAHLQQLQNGAAPPALRLFPYYCRLCELKAALVTPEAPPASPAAGTPAGAVDLFFPDLSLLDGLSASAALPLAAPTWRALFETALLAYLTGATPAPKAASMADVLGAVAQAQSEPRARGRWTVLHAFAAMAESALQARPADKRRCGLIHMQLRRLQNGERMPGEILLREILLAIAEADSRPPLAQRIAERCRLDELLPADLLARHYDSVLDYTGPEAVPTGSAAALGAEPDAELDVEFNAAASDGRDADRQETSAAEARTTAENSTAVAPLDLATELSASLEALLAESERPLEAAPEPAAAAGVIADAFDRQNLPVLQKHGRHYLTQIGQHLKCWRQNPADASLPAALKVLLRTLQEYADAAGALRLALALYELALPVDTHLELAAIRADGAPSQLFDSLLAHYAECVRLFEQLPPAMSQ